MKNILRNTMIITLVMVFLISCTKKTEVVSSKAFDGKFPDESASNIQIVFSDSGTNSFVLFAPLFNKYYGENEYMDFPLGITVVSYDGYGKEQSVLTADYAINEEKTMRMEALHNVVIKDLIKNETIETEQIIWNKREKKIFSKVAVKQIKADGSVNYGDGFEADERFTKYTVRNPRGEVITDEI